MNNSTNITYLKSHQTNTLISEQSNTFNISKYPFNNKTNNISLIKNQTNNNNFIPKSTNKTFTYNSTVSNIPKIQNNTIKHYTNNTSKNITKKSDQSKPFLGKNVVSPKQYEDEGINYALYLEIGIPIILIFLIIVIYCYIRKRKKSKISAISNDNLEQNKNQISNVANKLPYNRLQNTSGLGNNIGINPNNLSEIKVQNKKEEINNIISNSSGSSSGRRRREKKKSSKNNMGFEGKEGQIGMQNEIKEQIKQYVIDEHNNI